MHRFGHISDRSTIGFFRKHVRFRLYAVARKEGDDIGQTVSGFVGRVIVDRDYTNLLSHLQKRQGISNRTSGFTRVLPPDKNLVDPEIFLVGRGDQYRSS